MGVRFPGLSWSGFRDNASFAITVGTLVAPFAAWAFQFISLVTASFALATLLAIGMGLMGMSLYRTARETKRQADDAAAARADVEQLRAIVDSVGLTIEQLNLKTEEQAVRIESLRDAIYPVLELTRVPMQKQKLVEILNRIEQRRNSYIQAAKNPEGSMPLPEYAQYFTSEIAAGYRHLFKVDGRVLSTKEEHQLLLKQFETPESDRNPHTRFLALTSFRMMKFGIK